MCIERDNQDHCGIYQGSLTNCAGGNPGQLKEVCMSGEKTPERYSREAELSKAKSNQLEQRNARINEKNDTIKLLEELNINLSKTK